MKSVVSHRIAVSSPPGAYSRCTIHSISKDAKMQVELYKGMIGTKKSEPRENRSKKQNAPGTKKRRRDQSCPAPRDTNMPPSPPSPGTVLINLSAPVDDG